MRRVRLSLPRRYQVVVAVAVAVALWFVADWIVVTDTEKIERILDEIAAGAERGDAEAVTASVSPRYRHEGMSRADLVSLAEVYFRIYGPTRVKTVGRRIVVTNNLATAEAAVFARLIEGEGLRGGAPSRWQLSFRRVDGRWEITKVTPVELYAHSAPGWRSIRGWLGLPRGTEPQADE